MTIEDPKQKAIRLVQELITQSQEESIADIHPPYEIYIVWYARALQNWKALVSTSREDGAYYEVTYDGDKQQTYIDWYSKVGNYCVKDES